jgi:hypothetical protein
VIVIVGSGYEGGSRVAGGFRVARIWTPLRVGRAKLTSGHLRFKDFRGAGTIDCSRSLSG